MAAGTWQGGRVVERDWRAWPVGTRVVVRRRLPDGRFSDVLGEVVSRGEDTLVLETRTGRVEVPAAVIVTGKPIPPPPPRRERRVTPPED